MKRKTKKYRNSLPNRNHDEKPSSFRLTVVIIICILGFLGILAKLVVVQIVDHEYYKEKARINGDSRKIVPAIRGTIYDRKGRVLAKDVIHYNVAIGITEDTPKEFLFKKVAEALEIPESTIRRKVNANPTFTFIKRRVPAEKVASLKKLKIPGLVLQRQLQRSYPYKENGAHVIGYCDVDNSPLGGIEYQYNNYLQGKDGWKMYQRDAYGNLLLSLDYTGQNPIDGFDVMLNLDIDYQIVLEDELKQAVLKNKAEEGVAILMDPTSGEVLAMANYPQFDPNSSNRYNDFQRKNRAITDVVEPGSTFKFVMLTAALENLHLNLDRAIFFCENGRFKLYGQTIYDHKKYGWLTLRKVVQNSSNIGTMKVMQDLDKKVFYNYVRNFGFGIITGVDLPGESGGILHPLEDFSKTTHYYMSIGYEIGVTPLQLLNAYCVLANGGRLLQPRVMKHVLGAGHLMIDENEPRFIRKVISPETNQLITSTLIDVVKDGTGQNAAVADLTIAGKTGTAQLYDAKKGTYDNRKHLASFVGYFPAENPQFALLVMIRQPKGAFYGGLVAAPAFREMALRIASLANVNSVEFAESTPPGGKEKDFHIPHVEKFSLSVARELMESLDLKVRISGEGDYVGEQTEIIEDGKIVGVNLITGEKPAAVQWVMPALEGMSLKEALSVLGNYKISPSVEGHGVVVKQLPHAGVKIDEEKPVKLVCRPA